MLSIIIPTLNAGGALGRTLSAISSVSAELPCEVIVADGGSVDNTAHVAADGGAIFVETQRGRGRQLSEGVKAAVGEWFLFLHADTQPVGDWVGAISSFRTSADNVQRAGYFQFALDDQAWAARLLENMVAARGALFGLPYGDQGLLISRIFYAELGGFKPMPLMEDVDIIRRIGRHRLKILDAVAVTSSERYRRDGYILRPVRNLLCLSLYSVGVPMKYIDNIYQ